MRNHETLQELIDSSSLGLRRAAQVARIGRTSIWRWCRGLSTPQHAQAAALASALQVDVERVLEAASASQRATATDERQEESSPSGA